MGETKRSSKEVKKSICDAVWEGRIDGSTAEIAEQFGCSVSTALRILNSIIHFTSGDERFHPDENGYVIIKSGLKFGPSPVDVKDTGSISPGTPKKYYWMADNY